jgi:hypothetical protein
MIVMDDDTRLEILKDEYFKILEITERFDEKAIVMKGWSITLSTAAVGAALFKNMPALLVLAASGALFFWMIEAFWKSFQSAHYPRINAIESYFAGVDTEIEPLQIQSSWLSAWRGGLSASWPKRMVADHVALPHVVIIIVCLSLYFVMPLP